jgi:RND family efflux transporter MFP subunit
MKRLVFLAMALLALAAVGGAGYLGLRRAPAAEATPETPATVAVSRGEVALTVTAPGQLVGTREEWLSLAVAGRLAEISVRPGTAVAPGETLARLDSAPLAQALAEARLRLELAGQERAAQVAAAELAVESAAARAGQARASFPGITAAEIRLQEAATAESYAQSEYDKALDRPWEPAEVLAGYRQQLEQATHNRQIAEAELAEARNRQWAAGQEITAADTAVEQAQVALDGLQAAADPLLELAVSRAEADLAAATLRAPFAGVVLEVAARPGESVAAGQPIVVLADPAALEVRVTVVEEDLPLVRAGQPVELYFDAQPEAVAGGRVARIVPERVAGESRPLYPVYISLDTTPDGVLAGMTADASIVVERLDESLRLPRALVRAGAGETAQVMVWQNGRAEERAVRVGLRGDVYVAIVEGLVEGEAVVAE